MKKQSKITSLTIRDVWNLVCYAIKAVLACGLVFILPYLLLTGAGKGLDSFIDHEKGTKWISYAILAAVLYFVVSELDHVLQKLSDLFSELARIASGRSLVVKVLLVAAIIGSFKAWDLYPDVTFFAWVLVLIPTGFTYDRYKSILREKSAQTSSDVNSE